MKRTQFGRWPCGIARTTDLMGDWWTPLIVREAMYGSTRFEQFEEMLGLSRNILSQRLVRLVDAGIFDKRAYQQRPVRHEYRLTDKGRELTAVLLVEFAWGNKWMSPKGAPVVLVDTDTGEELDPVVVDRKTGKPIDLRRFSAAIGPGFPQKLLDDPRVVKRFGPSGEPSRSPDTDDPDANDTGNAEIDASPTAVASAPETTPVSTPTLAQGALQ